MSVSGKSGPISASHRTAESSKRLSRALDLVSRFDIGDILK
jgi:hypothetical protein